jgi:hypothetical protein
MDGVDTGAVHDKIVQIKASVQELRRMGDEFPAVRRNADRILASIKMLELNISDLYALNIYDNRETNK